MVSRRADANRVVLGKYEGQEAGYIGAARRDGGIYLDTGPHVWGTLGRGLSDERANELCWQVDESCLRNQMERGPARIDYVLDRGQFSSVEEILALDPHSFSAKEITFLKQNAQSYGYRQLGSSWLRVRIARK